MKNQGEEYITTKTSCLRVHQPLNKAVHTDCFDVFIIVLVTVIFSCSSSSSSCHSFQHFNILTSTINNVFNFLSEINIFNKLLIFAWHDIVFLC